jgi:hypothetical protein
MAARKPPSPAPITLKRKLGAEGKGWSWMSFTGSLIGTEDRLKIFGANPKYKMAAVAASKYGPNNAGAAEEVAHKAAKATPEGKEAMVRHLRSIWTGEADPNVPVSNLDVLHAAARGLWAEWSATEEGIASLAGKGIDAGDSFLALAQLGKAKAAGAALTAARSAKADSAVAAATEALAAARARRAMFDE